MFVGLYLTNLNNMQVRHHGTDYNNPYNTTNNRMDYAVAAVAHSFRIMNTSTGDFSKCEKVSPRLFFFKQSLFFCQGHVNLFSINNSSFNSHYAGLKTISNKKQCIIICLIDQYLRANVIHLKERCIMWPKDDTTQKLSTRLCLDDLALQFYENESQLTN